MHNRFATTMVKAVQVILLFVHRWNVGIFCSAVFVKFLWLLFAFTHVKLTGEDNLPPPFSLKHQSGHGKPGVQAPILPHGDPLYRPLN